MKDRVYLLGYAHIDLAWLWTKDETIHLVSTGTFSYALYLMKRYPFLRFAQSAAQIYKWIKENYPAIFMRIKEMVRKGNWEIVGGSWSEHNANLPSGETLIRQYLYGKKYFREKFGVDVKVAWLPDSFGFAWTIPQILKKCGIDYFLTSKLNWQLNRMKKPIPFPYHLFWWKSPDGSKVLAHLTIGGYAQKVDAESILKQLEKLKKMHNIPYLLVLFGYGDHGGGPNRDMIERALEISGRKDFPEIVFSTALEYFKNIEDYSEKIPIYEDELYLKTHRGTFTTEARVKKFLREAEVGLINSEKLSSIAFLLGGEYPANSLAEAWRKLLYITTHDIMDGTSIELVYKDLFNEEVPWIREAVREAMLDSTRELISKIDLDEFENPVVVFNTLSWTRSGIASIELPQDKGHVTVFYEDKPVLSQIIEENGSRKLLFLAEDVPPLGYKVYDLRGGKVEAETDLMAGEWFMENNYLRVEIDPETGLVKRIFDKKTGREVLDNSKRGNVLQLYEDKPPNAPGGESAWNMYLGNFEELTILESIEFVEKGPLRAVIRVKRRHGNSTYIQDIILYAKTPYVEFVLKAYWNERYKTLKVAFPLSFENDYATYEIPYGAIQRFRSDIDGSAQLLELPRRGWEEADKAKFEVPALKWANVDTKDKSFGVALLNDSKYGYSYEKNELKLTLLRGPRRGYPGTPESWADQSSNPMVGWHVIRYAIYLHEGDWKNGRVTHRGYEYNYPLIPVKAQKHSGHLPHYFSFIKTVPEDYILTVVKKAEDDNSLILRIYDPYGREGEATIVFSLFAKIKDAYEVDFLEGIYYHKPLKVSQGKISIKIKPFEIKAIKVR